MENCYSSFASAGDFSACFKKCFHSLEVGGMKTGTKARNAGKGAIFAGSKEPLLGLKSEASAGHRPSLFLKHALETSTCA